jgi:hypothetical protein
MKYSAARTINIQTFTYLKAFLAVAGLLFFLGCSGGKGHLPGSSSGGGGFAGENSKILLDKSSSELATILRTLEPGSFKNLPNSWTPEKMARVLEAIELKPRFTDMRVRHGKELVFDYNEQTNKITALPPFFTTYNVVAVHDEPLWKIRPYIKNIQRYLLHELGHLVYKHGTKFSGNTTSVEEIEGQARSFAEAILKLIDHDLIICKTKDFGQWPVPRLDGFFLLDEKLRNGNVCGEPSTSFNDFKSECDPLDYLTKTVYQLLVSKAYGYAFIIQDLDIKEPLPKSLSDPSIDSPDILSHRALIEREKSKGLKGLLAHERLAEIESISPLIREGTISFKDYSSPTLDQGQITYTASFEPFSKRYWRTLTTKDWQEELTLERIASGQYRGHLTYQGHLSEVTDDQVDIRNYTNALIQHTSSLPFDQQDFNNPNIKWYLKNFLEKVHLMKTYESSVDADKKYDFVSDRIKTLQELFPEPGSFVQQQSFSMLCESIYQTVDFSQIR